MRRQRLDYGSTTEVTISLAALASDTALLAGRQSDEVVLTAERYVDIWIGGYVTLGTSPTGGRSVEVWVLPHVFGSYPSPVGTADDALTVPSRAWLVTYGRNIANVTSDNVSDRRYIMSPTSVANAFMGWLPRRFVLFVVQDTGVALHGTGSNHALFWQPVWRVTE